MTDRRHELLAQMSRSIIQAAGAGLLGDPIPVYRAETIAGPRAGAVRLYAGLATGALFSALSANSAAMARQFVSWPFTGDPAVYLDGQALRVEAPWPAEIARDVILLRSVCRQPRENGRWTLGVNEFGQTVVGAFNNDTAHWLVAGTTGSGKSCGLQSVGFQMSQAPRTRLVLVDGKDGAGLSKLVNLPRVVGPMATDVVTAREALGWVHREMAERYAVIAEFGEREALRFPMIIVLFDEFQNFTDDVLVAELVRRLAEQGRAARVHLMLATHHPTVSIFGKDNAVTKRLFAGRLALRVMDAKASEVIVGAPVPRADRLTGAGDAYAIGNTIHRTQLVLVDDGDFDAAERRPPKLDAWPPFQAADVGQEPTVQWSYSGQELACGLISAWRGKGRPTLQRAVELMGLPRPGSTRAARLLSLCTEQHEALGELNVELVSDSLPAHLSDTH